MKPLLHPRLVNDPFGDPGLYIDFMFDRRAIFQRRPETVEVSGDGVLLDEETFRVRCAFLDHKIPCLGFALEEKLHVNVWKSGLERLGLPVGPWLRDLKTAVARGAPDETILTVHRPQESGGPVAVRLGALRSEALRLVPGQKIVYVTDAVYHPENAATIVELARDADWLFLEATFSRDDEARAAERHHLTSAQAGRLARQAGARRLVPFHFSPKYAEEGDRLAQEAQAAFEGTES
jgi:ribonuclease Z